jgi:pimeloyl-ACP methyl ester carboxylesterase
MPEVPGVSHRFISAGGLWTHVAEAGDGPPLVMLHGWPQHWWLWRALIGPLSESHHVLCPDLRGFGWTAAPPAGYDPEIFAQDIVALLDALEIDEPVDLVGHDWGGWTGHILCLRHPDRIRRFLALSVYHPFGRATPRALTAAWRLWYQWLLALPGIGSRLMRGAASQPILRWIGATRAPWSADEVEVYIGQFSEQERAAATSLLYRHSVLELAPKVVRGEYRRLRTPIPGLMLVGTADQAQDARLMRGFERYAPNMRLELVPEVGHFIVEERKDLVLEHARELFAV